MSIKNIRLKVYNMTCTSCEKTMERTLKKLVMVAVSIILIGNSTGGFDMNNMLKGATYFVLFAVGVLTSIHCVKYLKLIS
ncbi:hypothetical protein WY13_00100 [Clostridium ljungdahlii]|uniref:Uncharacterized protein n=1 Tax=Clostridium ljungdahlii TaxID=1538 RepID=A0A166SJI0_9CLOT|nr:hypothetical protein WY13_00100 [Clostridium ljungdahlii]